MPEAERNALHDQIKQTVQELLQQIHDPTRAASLIAAVVARHAPELSSWANQLIRSRHPALAAGPLPLSAVQPPKTLYSVDLAGIAPITAHSPRKRSDVTTVAQECHFRADPELARLSIVLHLAAPFRIWIIARELVRRSSGSGKLERQHLERQVLEQVPYSRRHVRRLLADGDAVFWNCAGDSVYVRSAQFVSRQLVDQAQSAGLGRLETNLPGARDSYLDVSGTLERFEAAIYAAWMSHRNNPTISRSELTHLFGRDKSVLIRWEKHHLSATLQKRNNFAQCANVEAFYDYIPREFALPYTAYVRFKNRVRPVQRIRWQLPNTYQVSGVRQHPRRGQAGKVRRLVNDILDRPALIGEAGLHRVYFDDAKTIRRLARKHPALGPGYLWRGEDQAGSGIFEINRNGYPPHPSDGAAHVKSRNERTFLPPTNGV